ncbi:Hypothetical predicted protein [Podarcis lilfordi]|uniref:Uncharacterized protein n=1 Tax=Podarcis lilfordi TaxID=74358 RepID=A0AA35L5I4_9SAUR|nr:Hypothetical predicted protein [Podarcis lilfordi]
MRLPNRYFLSQAEHTPARPSATRWNELEQKRNSLAKVQQKRARRVVSPENTSRRKSQKRRAEMPSASRSGLSADGPGASSARGGLPSPQARTEPDWSAEQAPGWDPGISKRRLEPQETKLRDAGQRHCCQAAYLAAPRRTFCRRTEPPPPPPPRRDARPPGSLRRPSLEVQASGGGRRVSM